ncbi:hypothetical protein NDU88_007085 [Pleurodeles waltl]|uniref:Uncharacterized protein n=1 Tax=Pleurodeles waltl TaxID=8319 RepID=A0AAV7U0F4_PLEWA|nr:hypothetical protein NDU88_007085 [Pleurodeles waltl]
MQKDATRESTAKEGDNTGKAMTGEEKGPCERGAETESKEEEQLEESSERPEREGLTTCHVPGEAWLEQVRARIQAWNSVWAQPGETRETTEEDQEG